VSQAIARIMIEARYGQTLLVDGGMSVGALPRK
jgi:hypothetical protein